MIPASFYTLKCTVKHRLQGTRDMLNAPSYGEPSSWETIYTDLPCSLEVYSKSDIQFKPTGERMEPTNILYVGIDTPLDIEDRIYFAGVDSGLGYDQEFVVQGANPAIDMMGQIDHLEYELIIP
jgi:hypothetical protein